MLRVLNKKNYLNIFHRMFHILFLDDGGWCGQWFNLVQVPKRSGISQLHGQRGGAQHSSSVLLCVCECVERVRGPLS